MNPSRQPLDIYLRTYIGGNVHGGVRVGNLSKEEVVRGCFTALLNSIEEARGVADIRVTIIDDHSPESFLKWMKQELKKRYTTATFVALEGETGNSASFRKSYACARETSRDLIYFVEDDYLHAPHAIREMLQASSVLRHKFPPQEVAFVPVDEPDNYGRLLEESRIVVGSTGYFRSVTHSTGTLMLSRNLLLRAWSQFMAFALYGIMGEVSEGATINRIWNEESALLFAPIPTLALHLQAQEQISPYQRWEAWWKRYADLSTP